jgi:universal stress protein E
MRRFRNVLVHYDDAVGGDDALSQAIALCRRNNAQLTVATVLREAGLDDLAETSKRMERLVSGIRQAGVRQSSARVLTGNPFVEITRQVVREHHDLVILSAEAGKALRDVFIGRAAAHLMRKCPCPVWVIRPGQAVPYKQILVAIDPVPGAPADNLSVKIVDMAVSLASRDQALLHFVHAWDVAGKDLETIQSETTNRQYREILEKHEAEHRRAVKDLLAGYPLDGIPHHLHLPREVPERAIVSLAEAEEIDLIVMGTAGRYGFSGLLVGNAVEAVLRSVKCGMLAVKPDHFVTPVALPENFFVAAPNSVADNKVQQRIA